MRRASHQHHLANRKGRFATSFLQDDADLAGDVCRCQVPDIPPIDRDQTGVGAKARGRRIATDSICRCRSGPRARRTCQDCMRATRLTGCACSRRTTTRREASSFTASIRLMPRERISHRKQGAPANAVTIPIGSSSARRPNSRENVRPCQRRSLRPGQIPATAADGPRLSRGGRDAGIIRPTKPIPPLSATRTPVVRDVTTNPTAEVDQLLCRVSRPALLRDSRCSTFSNMIHQHRRTGETTAAGRARETPIARQPGRRASRRARFLLVPRSERGRSADSSSTRTGTTPPRH